MLAHLIIYNLIFNGIPENAVALPPVKKPPNPPTLNPPPPPPLKPPPGTPLPPLPPLPPALAGVALASLDRGDSPTKFTAVTL